MVVKLLNMFVVRDKIKSITFYTKDNDIYIKLCRF